MNICIIDHLKKFCFIVASRPISVFCPGTQHARAHRVPRAWRRAWRLTMKKQLWPCRRCGDAANWVITLSPRILIMIMFRPSLVECCAIERFYVTLHWKIQFSCFGIFLSIVIPWFQKWAYYLDKESLKPLKLCLKFLLLNWLHQQPGCLPAWICRDFFPGDCSVGVINSITDGAPLVSPYGGTWP